MTHVRIPWPALVITALYVSLLQKTSRYKSYLRPCTLFAGEDLYRGARSGSVRGQTAAARSPRRRDLAADTTAVQLSAELRPLRFPKANMNGELNDMKGRKNKQTENTPENKKRCAELDKKDILVDICKKKIRLATSN